MLISIRRAAQVLLCSSLSSLAAQASEPTTVELPRLTVHDTAEGEYMAPDSTTATKTDTPIAETPMSVQVITSQVLADQSTHRLDSALNNVSGVFSGPMNSGGGNADYLVIRGFQSYDVFYDGIRLESAATGPIDMANVERIEVLKGPGAMLFGRVEPGGVVNVIRKAPQATRSSIVEAQAGSFGFGRVVAGTTGALSGDAGLTFRLDAAYERGDSFQDFRSNEDAFASGALRWQPSTRTQANLRVEYKHARDPVDYGIPADGNRPIPVSRQFSANEPGNRNVTNETISTLDWSHAFADNWSVRQALRWRTSGMTNRSTGVWGIGLAGAGDGPQDIDRYYGVSTLDSRSLFTSLELTGKLHGAGLEHTLLFGADYFHYRQDNPVRAMFADFLNYVTGVRSDLGAGLTGQLIQDGMYRGSESDAGVYVQDQITLPAHVHLLVGIRHDHAKQSFSVEDRLNVPPYDLDNRADDRGTTPRFGALWQVTPSIGVYANYAENFGAPNTTNANPSLGTVPARLKPETAEQKELGIKFEGMGGLLTATFAAYDLLKKNISAPDPVTPGRSVLIGQVRNRGLEADISGQPAPGWNLIASLSLIDSRIEKDAVDASGNPTGNQGHAMTNVPRESASFWVTRDVGAWRFGGGAVYRSEQQGDVANSFQLPGYVVANLMASYHWSWGTSRASLQVNVDNLADRTYFVNSNQWTMGGANFGAARTIKAALRVEL